MKRLQDDVNEGAFKFDTNFSACYIISSCICQLKGKRKCKPIELKLLLYKMGPLP